MRIPSAELKSFCSSVLAAAKVRRDVAKDVGDSLIQSSLRGVDSHGIRLLPHYLRALKAGRVNPDPKFDFKRTAPSSGILDADHAFGHAAGAEAMRKALDLAADAGMGAVAVKNSSHFGAAAYFALLAASRDMLGMAFTHADSLLLSFGGTRSYLGANPVAFAAPMEGEEPLSLDMSTSAVAWFKVLKMRELGQELPPGVAADEMGRETRDAQRARSVLPMGGSKGFGLSFMVEIFCSMMTGMAFGKSIVKMLADPIEKKRRLGHFVLAMDISRFVPVSEFKQRLRQMAEELRSEPSFRPEQPVMVPGDPEKKTEAERRRLGIPLDEQDVENLTKAGREWGIFLRVPSGV